jgi:hypothetical protein
VLLLYCTLASSTYVAMEIYAVLRPIHTQAFLASFRAWLASAIQGGSSRQAGRCW